MGNAKRREKIGIYSPYLHILGGGERYITTIAYLLKADFSVELFSNRRDVLNSLEAQFDLNLDGVEVRDQELFFRKSSIDKLQHLAVYKVFFYLTDGSVFFSTARNNILLVQSPAHVPKKSVINKIKLFNWKIVCNSMYVANIVKQKLDIHPDVLYPPIIKPNELAGGKQKIILTVGRFFKGLHSKRQDEMIDVFLKNAKKFPGYELHLCGALTEESGRDYVEVLKEKIKGSNVKIHVNPSYLELTQMYNKAQIYWHAAGYGADLVLHPEMAEHFGMTTLEASAYGVVPIVFAGGGQKEIITNAEDGFLWKTTDELVSITYRLISDERVLNKVSAQARVNATKYSQDKFYENLKKSISI